MRAQPPATAVARWLQEERARSEGTLLPGLLSILPLCLVVLMSAFVSRGGPEAAPTVQEPQMILEVLVGEDGTRLRRSPISVEAGWPAPLRMEAAAILEDHRLTYVPRLEGVDGGPGLVAAARDLLGPGETADLWLRGTEGVAWMDVIAARRALESVRADGSDSEAPSLARVLLDVRP